MTPPSWVFAYEWQAKDLRDMECVRVANNGLTEGHFCASVQPTTPWTGTPPGVLQKRLQAIDLMGVDFWGSAQEAARV